MWMQRTVFSPGRRRARSPSRPAEPCSSKARRSSRTDTVKAGIERTQIVSIRSKAAIIFRRTLALLVGAAATGLAGLSIVAPDSALAKETTAKPPASADELLVVDCLLPGQIRQLGQRTTYASARRPAKIPARDCQIRGGEYVSYDRADWKTSLNVWLPAAQLGDAEAGTIVGEIFE